jgi:hypothetical protein
VSLEVLIAVRFRGAVASGLVRVRACSCAVGKGWLTCSFGRYVQVGLQYAEELEFLGVQGVKWLLGGARGVLWRGYAWWILGCHWWLWAKWLDLDDKL